MKNDPVTGLLVGLLALSAVASAVLLLFFYAPTTRRLRTLQGEVATVNARGAVINALIQDTVLYSREHPNPAINRIVEMVTGVKPTAPAPAAKPARR